MAPPVLYHEDKFPPSELDWPKLIPLLGPTSAALARYDGMLGTMPNAALLLSPLMTQEAVLSSRIEGTQATMGEVLEFEAEGDRPDMEPQRRADIQEILNYRRAMRRAGELLQDLPLCLRVVREAHAMLLEGVRGQGKAPGEFRKTPNWIGPAGCKIDEARFIPIPADKLGDALGVWENYIHTDQPDRLIQLAILHAEFEALHPFLDGNGRLGRMLVPLFMARRGLISSPMFYISAFFEANRDEYYDRLLAVSRDGDWTAWCVFFLRAVQAQAEENLSKVKQILDLYDRMKIAIAELTRSQYAIHAQDFIFSRPIFPGAAFHDEAGIPKTTALRILRRLCDKEILSVLVPSAGRRPSVMVFPELLNIAEGREVF